MDLKQRFCKKLYEELNAFKVSSIQGGKDDIFGQNGKKEIFASLYEILLESADNFSDMLLSNLVNQSTNILESLYTDFITDCGATLQYEDLRNRVAQRFDDEEECYEWWNEQAYMDE